MHIRLICTMDTHRQFIFHEFIEIYNKKKKINKRCRLPAHNNLKPTLTFFHVTKHPCPIPIII